jgi:hypothetical protein
MSLAPSRFGFFSSASYFEAKVMMIVKSKLIMSNCDNLTALPKNLIVESNIREKPTNTPSTSLVSNLFTKKNKVTPLGGRKKRKTTRSTKKRRRSFRK